jgi:medium-chain acyl-[acyl-carrier-protein] hydrolase
MNRWISRDAKRSSPPTFRIFCLPYAGGSSATYRQWQQALPEHVEVCAVCLPGRGSRFGEPLYSEMSALTEALAEALAPELDLPYALFGHSMGAMVAFELARVLRARGARLPSHLFLSGRPGYALRVRPHVDPPMPDSALVEMLSALNGTSDSALANSELVSLMLPVLRADMTIVQAHRHEHQVPLDCGITAFGGDRDPTFDKDGLMRWRAMTHGPFRMHLLEGDHFFINSNPAPVLETVGRTILQLEKRSESLPM